MYRDIIGFKRIYLPSLQLTSYSKIRLQPFGDVSSVANWAWKNFCTTDLCIRAN